MADRRFEDEEFETSAPRRARTASIATMGQLLLQGYAMLADSCETCGVPLMRKPNSQEIICVNCNSAGEEGEGREQTHPAPSTPARPIPNGISNGHLDDAEEEVEAAPLPLRERIAPSTRTHTTRNTAPQSPHVDSSQALADKMLEGWALLAEHCPLCSTPFVRSRDGRIYCVACDLYAVREGAGARQQPDIAAAAPPLSNVNEEEMEVGNALLAGAVRNDPGSRNIGRVSNKNNLEDAADAVRGNLVTAQSFIAARLASRAASLEKASTSKEATTLLEEIQACIHALNGIKTLL